MGNTSVRGVGNKESDAEAPPAPPHQAAHPSLVQGPQPTTTQHWQQHHACPVDPKVAHSSPLGGEGLGRLGQVCSNEFMLHRPPDSAGGDSRSPLTFTPQISTIPMAKIDELPLGYQPGLYGYTQGGYAQGNVEKGIPTMITWSHDGTNVSVEGSWDNWGTREPLQKSGKDFTIMKILPSGVYQYKFIVDGKWSYAPDLPAMYDGMGNVNNVLDVQDYVPENLDSIAGFDPPPSPDSSYSGTLPGPDDFAKDPPLIPPHLHLTLLKVPPMEGIQGTGPLTRPQHVILNHTYVEKGTTVSSVLTLGLTHRYRAKFVTLVLYKPVVRS